MQKKKAARIASKEGDDIVAVYLCGAFAILTQSDYHFQALASVNLSILAT